MQHILTGDTCLLLNPSYNVNYGLTQCGSTLINILVLTLYWQELNFLGSVIY